MKITVQIQGGLAAIPGLSRPFQVETAGLAPGSAQALEELVAHTAFFEQPETVPEGGGADRRTYTITVVDGPRSHTIRRMDPLTEELASLVRTTRQLAGR